MRSTKILRKTFRRKGSFCTEHSAPWCHSYNTRLCFSKRRGWIFSRLLISFRRSFWAPLLPLQHQAMDSTGLPYPVIIRLYIIRSPRQATSLTTSWLQTVSLTFDSWTIPRATTFTSRDFSADRKIWARILIWRVKPLQESWSQANICPRGSRTFTSSRISKTTLLHSKGWSLDIKNLVVNLGMLWCTLALTVWVNLSILREAFRMSLARLSSLKLLLQEIHRTHVVRLEGAITCSILT